MQTARARPSDAPNAEWTEVGTHSGQVGTLHLSTVFHLVLSLCGSQRFTIHAIVLCSFCRQMRPVARSEGFAQLHMVRQRDVESFIPHFTALVAEMQGAPSTSSVRPAVEYTGMQNQWQPPQGWSHEQPYPPPPPHAWQANGGRVDAERTSAADWRSASCKTPGTNGHAHSVPPTDSHWADRGHAGCSHPQQQQTSGPYTFQQRGQQFKYQQQPVTRSQVNDLPLRFGSHSRCLTIII